MLQAQKKKVNIEQQQTKDIKRITTPLQTILKDNNESVLNALKKTEDCIWCLAKHLYHGMQERKGKPLRVIAPKQRCSGTIPMITNEKSIWHLG